MGNYLNPGNSGFSEILHSDYVDKTGMIRLINQTIGTTKKLTCVSRPRRFGKSYAAQMLCAYYDRSCDSESLFAGCQIAKEEGWKAHLNRYHVLNLDIAGFVSEARQEGIALKEIPARIAEAILREVKEQYPETDMGKTLTETLLALVEKTGTRIVFILDEWDAVIRESGGDREAQKRYFSFLRGLFKNGNFTPKAVAAAYMTGILPIRKDRSQSAISDFYEYSMLQPGAFAEYVGFTEEEVKQLCASHDRDFASVKNWYDGYMVGSYHSVYNPYSVMQAIHTGMYRSYWKKTSASETLITYIDMDQEGLQEDVVRLVAGESVEVETGFFENDVDTFSSRDDVLTLLIHLGYLTYEEVADSYGEAGDLVTGFSRIPNEEVRTEFRQILRKGKHRELIRLIRQSDRLLEDTLAGNEEAVAKAISAVRDLSYAPAFYNDEQSLRYAIKMAYISCVDQYAMIEELPSGHGIADVVFLPKRRSPLPAMVIELKWNRDVAGAIEQIRDRNYPSVLRSFGGEILLVGITYDEKNKKHCCRIERISARK